ncbi:MAG: J domain-containing protein [Thermomonas sp.]|jgi:curved DNA-binding protein CbpA|uniref:J domain-containing protein n=1 Tax=Thermomonas sp. TaxID=1971895 RepID=UPI001EC81343|nr:J domain-containing protein [Thermomonas sp.]MBK6415667.1 J domain-containing protein [Thermomonas sp.]MBK6924826.1 J domain-containing protein [Thermomonas sp.]MBK7206448.1 J domain-containing protein [Thermomonas sp.]
MDGAKGSALEWALALLHAPGKRHALRQKPLPSGMDRLLGIAAGAMPDALAEAVRTFGEPEARIREAAQFYVREVLFFAQADAYRVLGVDADASDASIKAHHRLLQHWLHPDRLDNEDDAIFASRVNVAWNRLRNPERREAYDRTLQDGQPLVEFDADVEIARVRNWIPGAEVPRNPWRHRAPVLVLSAACLLLVVMVLRDTESGEGRWESVSNEAPGDGAAPGITEISVPSPTARTAPADATRRAAATVRAAERSFADRTAIAASLPPMPVVEIAPLTEQAIRELEAASQAPVVPVRVPVPVAKAPAPVAVAVAAPVANAPVPVAVPVPKAPTPAVARLEATPVSAGSAPGPLAEYIPPAVAKSAARAQPLPSYARIQQAWAAGDQLLRFMAAVGRPPPPIWNSPGIQSSADALRQDMHGGGRVRLSGAQWQIGEQSAVLTSAYVVRGKQADAGQLTADLAWRGDRWLVVGLSIERVQ